MAAQPRVFGWRGTNGELSVPGIRASGAVVQSLSKSHKLQQKNTKMEQSRIAIGIIC